MSESAGLVHIESHPLINELERVIYISAARLVRNVAWGSVLRFWPSRAVRW
jgi:hypothetical protein